MISKVLWHINCLHSMLNNTASYCVWEWESIAKQTAGI